MAALPPASEGFSMTPPSSPVTYPQLDDEEEMIVDIPELGICTTKPKLVQFSCLGDVHPVYMEFDGQSYLKQGCLNTLIQHKECTIPAQMFSYRLYNLFGCQFITNSCLTTSPDNLFFMARQKYSILESGGVESGFGSNFQEKADYSRVREDILSFVNFINAEITRLCFEDDPENRTDVLLHLKNLLVHIGRLSDLPSHVFVNCMRGNTSTSAGYHLFHLHLDIIWSLIQIFYVVQVKDLGNVAIIFTNRNYAPSTTENILSEYLSVVLWDLVIVAMRRFKKVSFHEYRSTSPFPCTCVRELWAMIIIVLDDMQEQKKGDGFWVMMKPIFYSILHEKVEDSQLSQEKKSDSFEAEPEIDCSNRTGFGWWLLMNLSTLYQTNCPEAQCLTKSHLRSNYPLSNDLITRSLHATTVDEVHLRCYLQCCVAICQVWEPSADILSLLWNHFFKNLNSSFCLANSLEGFQSLPSSGAKWLQQLKNNLSEGSVRVGTSYELFLGLIQLQLGRSENGNCVAQDWKQFKGRLYAKFHPKKMLELNDLGIQNFISLFLTMASILDFEDVVTHMCSLLDMKPLISLTTKQLSTMWTGLFAVMLLAQLNSTAVDFVAQKLASSFNNICQTMSQEKLEPMERHEKLKLIVLYVKGFQEVIENSQHLNTSEHYLIASGFNILLPSCKNDEMHLVLSAIQMLITKQRIIFRRAAQLHEPTHKQLSDHKELAKALRNNILPFIKEHSKTLTPPQILAELAAALTFTASDLHEQTLGMPGLETRGSLFRYFGLSSDINPELCCHYLCSLLTQQDLVEKFMAEIRDFQALLICSWFRCTVILLPSNDLLQQLTRLIAKLPEMNDIISKDGFTASDVEDPLWVQFCKALTAKFNSLQNLCDKIAFRKRTELYFNDIMKPVNPILKNFSPTDQLRNVYQVLGTLVQQCSPLLYIKSKADGLLHDIMNRIILQRIIYKHDAPIPPILQAVLRETLKMFVQGLLTLHPHRDPCISNRLKDIVVHYTLRFSPKSGYNGGYTLHPILECMSDAFSADATDQTKEFLSFVLEVIRDHFFARRLQFTSGQLLSVTYLITGLLEESLDETRVTISQVLLMPSLQVLLLTDDAALKQNLRSAVKLMVESCKRSENTTPKSTWVPKIKEFIVKHISTHGNNLFRLLEVLATWYPALVKEMIPTITDCIHAAEEKRGVGQDRVLRQGQCRLLQRLGIQVQESVMNKQ